MTIRTQVPALLAAAALCAALAACESAEKVSAEQKVLPGENVAYQRPALSRPPDYTARPEPKDDAQQAQQAPLTRQERATRQNEPVYDGTSYSPGTKALLKETGAPSTPPNIRELVRRETTILSHEDRRFVDRLIFGDAIDRGSDAPEIVLQRDDGTLPF
jgi:hypothetical protein